DHTVTTKHSPAFSMFDPTVARTAFQSLYLAEDLRLAAFRAGDVLTALSFKLNDLPAISFRGLQVSVALAPPSLVELRSWINGTVSVSGCSDCTLSSASLQGDLDRDSPLYVSELVTIQLDHPFTWDGQSGLVLEVSRTIAGPTGQFVAGTPFV